MIYIQGEYAPLEYDMLKTYYAATRATKACEKVDGSMKGCFSTTTQ